MQKWSIEWLNPIYLDSNAHTHYMSIYNSSLCVEIWWKNSEIVRKNIDVLIFLIVGNSIKSQTNLSYVNSVEWLNPIYLDSNVHTNYYVNITAHTWHM